jgi:hypothetical protein
VTPYLLPDRFAKLPNGIFAQAEPGTALGDILKPEFWAMVSQRLTAGDEITAACRLDGEPGGGYCAKLRVVSANGASALVVLESWADLDSAVRCPRVPDGD